MKWALFKRWLALRLQNLSVRLGGHRAYYDGMPAVLELDEVLDELAARAEAATPGPWNVTVDAMCGEWDIRCADYSRLAVVLPRLRAKATAAHIAAASPDVVLALVAEVRKHREDLSRIEGAWEEASHDYSRLLGERRRLRDLLECESGRKAPEGWTWEACEWRSESAYVTRLRYNGGWAVVGSSPPSGDTFPYALEAIEAVEASDV